MTKILNVEGLLKVIFESCDGLIVITSKYDIVDIDGNNDKGVKSIFDEYGIIIF